MLPNRDDLKGLAEPAILEGVSYDAILQRRKDLFLAVAASEGLDVGQFVDLESATETILLEEASYNEMLLRKRINEVYRAGLLYYAEGTTLDHVAEGADHGVTRLPGETDEDFRDRVRIEARGSAAAGSDDWWIFHARSVSPLVEDVAVARSHFPFPRPGEVRGHLTLSILARTPDGIPSTELLAAVQAKVSSSAVRNTCAAPHVVAAASVVVDIAARVWLRPDAAPGTFEALEAVLRTKWAADRALGWDVVPDWVSGTLRMPGVQKVVVDAPTTDVVVGPGGAARLGTVALTLAGRNY